MEALRRQTLDEGESAEFPSQQGHGNPWNNDTGTSSSIAQHSTTTSNTLASFLAGSRKPNGIHDIRSSERVSRLRKQKEEASAAINALNQFIFVAGHTFKGRQLNRQDQKRLREAAEQVGLSLDVVDALVEQTSDPNAVLNYCMASDDAFATRMKHDPQLSRLLAKGAGKQDGNGFDVADSVWRIFMHKIIQQFLKDHDMQLSDVMSKESLTSRLYEEALRNEKKSSVDYGNDQVHPSRIQRDYTKERERLIIPEEEAKIARQQAEANMNFQVNRSLLGFVTRDSEDYFVSKDQTITTDDILSLRPGIISSEDVSIGLSGAIDRDVQLHEPIFNTTPNHKTTDKSRGEPVSAVKRGLAMFEKSNATSQVDTQRPRRRSLEALEQSKILASKAKFEVVNEEKSRIDHSQTKSSQRTSLMALHGSKVVSSNRIGDGVGGSCGDSRQHQRSPVKLISTPIVKRLTPNATNFFECNEAIDRIEGQKPDNSPGADVFNKPSKGNFVKSTRQVFERHHAGEISEGESKPGRATNSTSERRQSPQLKRQASVSRNVTRCYANNREKDLGTPKHVENTIHGNSIESTFEQETSRSQKPEYVVIQTCSDDSNGIFSSLTQSCSSSTEDEHLNTRKVSTSRSRRRSRSTTMASSEYQGSPVPFTRSRRNIDAAENDSSMILNFHESLERQGTTNDCATDMNYGEKDKKKMQSQKNHPGINGRTQLHAQSLSKQNGPIHKTLTGAFASNYDNTTLYCESRDDECQVGVDLRKNSFPSIGPSSARRPEQDLALDEDEGWVDFGAGFIRPPRRSSFGGRSGRGLSEGDNESLRQPSERSLSPRQGSTKILLENRRKQNQEHSGELEQRRLSVVERAESWSRKVRTLLSDEDQPPAPRLQNQKSNPITTTIEDGSTVNTRDSSGKEFCAVAVQSSRWIKFDDNTFAENHKNYQTYAKADTTEEYGRVDMANVKYMNLSENVKKGTSGPHHKRQSAPNYDVMGTVETFQYPSKQPVSSHNSCINSHSDDPKVVGPAASKAKVASKRGADEVETNDMVSHDGYTSVESDPRLVVWSADGHVASCDSHGLNTMAKGKVLSNENENVYAYLPQDSEAKAVSKKGYRKVERNKVPHDHDNPSVVVWSADEHRTMHDLHGRKTCVHREKDSGSTLLPESDRNDALTHDSCNSVQSDPPNVVWSTDGHYATRDSYGQNPRIKKKATPREHNNSYVPDTAWQNLQNSQVHAAQKGKKHEKQSVDYFRQEQSFDGASLGLYGQTETTRSMSSESDFDAVNAYNESDVRRIEIIQASEHGKANGTTVLHPNSDQESYAPLARPQQPDAPLLSNRGSRASDIMGNLSRRAEQKSTNSKQKSDLNSRMNLNSFPTTTRTSNLDATARHSTYIEEDIDCRQQPVMNCQVGPEKSCEIDPNNACTVGGVRILETSYQPMNGGPPIMVPVGAYHMHPTYNDLSGGNLNSLKSQNFPDEEFDALNSYLDSYEYDNKANGVRATPHTPTTLVNPSLTSHPVLQPQSFSALRQPQREDEIGSLGNTASSSTLSDVLNAHTRSTEDDNRDDVDLHQDSSDGNSRDRYLDAEPGFDEHVQGPTSPTQLRSSDSESTVDEEDIRRAAERRGLSPDVVEVLINHSNSKIRRAPLKGMHELPPLNDFHRNHETPIDSDTCQPASARHLRKDVGPDAYVAYDQRTSWDDIANSHEHEQSYESRQQYHLPPDCPPPDPSPREAQAILAALQENAADAYYNRRVSLQSIPGMPEIPEGATEEELNLLNRFIEVAASNFDGKKLSVDSEKRVRAAAEKVGLSQKFVDQLLEQANANNNAKIPGGGRVPVPSVGVPASPVDDESTFYTQDKTQATTRANKHTKEVGCNAWEQWDNVTKMLRQWANCGGVGDIHQDDDEDGDEDLDDGSTIESEDRYREELTKKFRKAQKRKKKHRKSKSSQRGFV